MKGLLHVSYQLLVRKNNFINKSFIKFYSPCSIFRNKINFCSTMADSIKEIFQGRKDRFEGVTVDSVVEPCEINKFPEKLEESLQIWSNSNKRGIWFKVDLQMSDWVPILTKYGFKFHHARENFVMMYKWLPNEVCNIPPYAHTLVGIGAVVVNQAEEVLVVREKYAITPFWKLPGGYVEPGENFVDAVKREVLEETNIKTEFMSLLALRHGHGGMYNCSDIYMVASLSSLSDDLQKCKQEIAEVKWLKIDEYLNHAEIHDLNKLFVKKYLEYKQNNFKIDVKHGIHQLLKKEYYVFSGSMENC